MSTNPELPRASQDAATESPDFDALAGATEAVRRVVTQLRRTQADASLLAEVERQANALADRLEPFEYRGPYAQAELVMPDSPPSLDRAHGQPSRFFPYSPVVGPLNAIAPPVDFRLEGDEMLAEHVFDPQYCGPPGSVHGGGIALVFDELLGCLGAMLGIGGFTGTLEVKYRSLTPLHQPIRMRGWVEREEGSKIFIHGTFHTTDPGTEERLCAEAKGIFIRPKQSVFEDARAKAVSAREAQIG